MAGHAPKHATIRQAPTTAAQSVKKSFVSFIVPILAFMTNEEHTNDAQGATAEEAKVEKMFEYGYRKSNYGPDELVTDAHGNPISVVDAMLSAEDAAKAETSTPHLCYYSPRIPGNTGSAIRLCAVTGTILHLVEPLGFNLRDTKLRRAGLDYHDMAHVVLHPNFDNLVESMPNSRIIAFTAHATKLYTDIEYKPTDILLFGPEPGNIPDPMDIMAGPHVAEQVRLPMRPSLRSLNLTNCASIAIYEAWRQLNFRRRPVTPVGPCLPTSRFSQAEIIYLFLYNKFRGRGGGSGIRRGPLPLRPKDETPSLKQTPPGSSPATLSST